MYQLKTHCDFNNTISAKKHNNLPVEVSGIQRLSGIKESLQRAKGKLNDLTENSTSLDERNHREKRNAVE